MVQEQDIKKDLDFLREIRIHLKKWESKRNDCSKDAAFQMINDWIDELKEINLEMTGEKV